MNTCVFKRDLVLKRRIYISLDIYIYIYIYMCVCIYMKSTDIYVNVAICCKHNEIYHPFNNLSDLNIYNYTLKQYFHLSTKTENPIT